MGTVVMLVLGAGIGLGLFLAAAGARGRSALPTRRPRRRAGVALRRRDVLLGVAVGAVVLVVTGWVVLAAAAAASTPLALRAAGAGRRYHAEIARVEAIASWTEHLRDTIAAANGLEHALVASGAVAPDPIAGPVRRLAHRVDVEPLTGALRAFADELAHPTGDFVVAALVIAAEKEARELGPLLGQLAACARAEAQLRARVWAGRARTRTSVRVITACILLFAAGLVVLDPVYLQPYGDLTGQVVLAAVVLCFAGSFVAMDLLGRIELPIRFLARRPELGDGAP